MPPQAPSSRRGTAPQSRRDGNERRPIRPCGRAPTRNRHLVPRAKIQASRMASPLLPASVGWSWSSETRSAGRTGCDASRPSAERLRAAVQRALEQGAAGRLAGRGQHVAGAVRQPLRIFEHGAVRRPRRSATLESEPTPKRPPCSRNCGAGKMPSPRLASVIGHRPATAPRPRHARWSPPRSCGWRGSGTSARRHRRWRAATRPGARPTRRGSPRPP